MQYEESTDAIQIKDGNFHWGVKSKKDEVKQRNQGKGGKPYDQNNQYVVEPKTDKKQQNIEESLLTEELLEKSNEEKNVNSILTLKGINMNIKHGDFVCIIGDVGSGKSSFLNSIIGDLLYLDNEFLKTNHDHPFNDELTEKI